MYKTTIKAGAMAMAFLCHSAVHAGIIDGTSNTLLTVSYTQGVIKSGPLSFGLAALPAEVNALFTLGPGTAVVGASGIFHYGVADVMSASVSFGDAAWTALASFELGVENGNVASLTYQFSPVFSNTVAEGIALNFPLNITGMDKASGAAFSYTYAASTQSSSSITVPEPGTLVLLGLGLAGLGFAQRKKK